jgi:hypothetical protein
MKLTTALCVLALVAGCGALTNETAVTESAKISSMAPSAFVYNPVATNILMVSAGGVSTPRQLAQWPALADMGISQTAFTMNGCAIRPPHSHMKASGLLYVISAANMSVGFVTEAGQSVVNFIGTGASTIFPQGLVHYQQNNDCSPAYYTISYNSEDPGTQVTSPALEKLPAAVVAASLGVDAATYASLTASLPKAAFIPNSDPDCVARCQAAGIDVLAPAPSKVATAVAGRR